MNVAKLGFIGLGNIGSRVVPHLLQAGHSLTVSDLNTSAVEGLVAQGAAPAANAGEASAKAEIVLLSLPTAAIVHEVVAGADGILTTAKPGTIIVDHSTIDPQSAREFAQLAAAHGVVYLDAPVSGGVQGAAAGTLSVIVGGDVGAFEMVGPILDAFSSNVFHVGPSGSGQVIKLANNIITAINIVALGEALSTTVANGVDLDTAVEVLSTSSANSTVLSSYFPRTLFTAERPTGFALDLMLKDIQLFLTSAATTPVPTPISHLVGDLYRIGHRDGRGGKDFTSVVEFYEDFSGTRLQAKGN